MTVTVQLFAAARELLGQSTLAVDLPEPCTVGQLRAELAAVQPRLQGLLARSAIAVNQDFASDESLIQSTDELAIIPPVSGG